MKNNLRSFGTSWSLLLIGCALASLAAWSGQAAAQSSASFKIGSVDVEAITRRSSSIQALIKQAEDSVQAMQDKIDAKVPELKQIIQSLESKRSVLGKTEIDAQESKIRTMRGEIDDMQYQVNKQLERIKTEIMDPEVSRIMKTVGEVAKREGYDLVVRSEAILFSNDKLDLTPLVIQALDKEGAGGKSGENPSATPTDKPKSGATDSKKPADSKDSKNMKPSAGTKNP